MTILPDDLMLDEDYYPDEMALDQIRNIDAIGPAGARWLVEMFPALAESQTYGSCHIKDGMNDFDEPVKLIHFSTGGWSGCEAFIEAVLDNRMLNILYYWSWRRGGHYTFVVPLSALEAK